MKKIAKYLLPNSRNDAQVEALRRFSCVNNSDGRESAGVPERRMARRAFVAIGTMACKTKQKTETNRGGRAAFSCNESTLQHRQVDSTAEPSKYIFHAQTTV